jgi:hypothetical protein
MNYVLFIHTHLQTQSGCQALKLKTFEILFFLRVFAESLKLFYVNLVWKHHFNPSNKAPLNILN